MPRASSQSGGLQNGDRVAIIGGGPPASFFAIHLLREAGRLNRHLDVVIVEKRGPTCHDSDDFQCKGCTFCAGIISPRLNAVLDANGLVVPEEIIQEHIERMYVIKIRGSQQEIMDALAKFGQPHARFLKMRFTDIRQVQGTPNQVGSVIRYRIPFIGLGTEMRLTKRVGFETLLYQADGRLVDHGSIIFNVAPTKDGNHRLSIYAAFDYKRGKGLARRMVWTFARLLFPGFVHDVVWNHALCTIKEEVEHKGDHTVKS